MSRELLFYVEGETEEEFAKEILYPHFVAKGIVCHGPILVANSVRKERTARGGVRSYAPIKKDLERLLRQWKSPNLRLTTMLDLYGLPKDFPATGTSTPNASGAEKAQAMVNAWRQDISDQRFIPFLFSYEFEALVLSNPDSLRVAYPESEDEIAALKNDIASFDNPEEINDSPETAPSKRILRHLTDYSKVVAGPLAICDLGLEKIRERCPHFNRWMTLLEQG